MNIANKIKFIRENILKMNQKTFANKIGVSTRTLYTWENGENIPSLTNIISISLISNILIDSMIFDQYPLKFVCNEVNDECYQIIRKVALQYEKNNKHCCK